MAALANGEVHSFAGYDTIPPAPNPSSDPDLVVYEDPVALGPLHSANYGRDLRTHPVHVAEKMATVAHRHGGVWHVNPLYRQYAGTWTRLTEARWMWALGLSPRRPQDIVKARDNRLYRGDIGGKNTRPYDPSLSHRPVCARANLRAYLPEEGFPDA